MAPSAAPAIALNAACIPAIALMKLSWPNEIEPICKDVIVPEFLPSANLSSCELMVPRILIDDRTVK